MIVLRTERLAAGGEVVARADDGRIVFVEGAVPEERVRAEVYEERPRFLRARVVEVLEPGPHRVEPPCPHFGRCGGCSLQHFEPEAQSAAKVEAAREAVRRLARGATDDAVVDPAWSGPAYAYRARARLLVEGGRLGYRARRTHRLVEVERCPILVPALEASLPRLAAALPDDARGELPIMAAGDRVTAWGEGFAGFEPDAVELVPPGRGLETTDAAGRAFAGPATFAQANPSGNDAMLETVGRWLPPSALALELYSGSGNFTRVLERTSARVVAAEADADAVRLADRVRGAATSLWRLDARRALERAARDALAPDLVLVDPPRAGLDRGVPDRLARLGPATIVYVSCDPGTFARDLARLGPRGYRVERLRFFDLYPQTPHVEVIGRLVRSPTPEAPAEASR